MIHHFQQVIFCSERANRAFMREISLAARNGMVTSVEKLPPHYEIPIGRMRPEDEEILRIDSQFPIEGYEGCPFCENKGVFYCDVCGKISCSKGASNHYCPGCQKIYKTASCEYNFMSKSGLLASPFDPPRLESPSGYPSVRNERPEPRRERINFENLSPNFDKGKALGHLRKFLEENKKFQIEDKRGGQR